MKSDHHKVRIDFMTLKIFLSICMSLQLISCGTTIPKQIYLTNKTLSGISRVAIISSVNAPEVSYSINSPNAGYSAWTILFGLIVFPAMALEAGIRSGVDKGLASGITEHTDLSYLENKLVRSFIEPVKKSACFETTEYLTIKNQDNGQLLTAGYDAIIRLSLHKISLERAVGGYLSLTVFVHGQLESLRSGSILWDREEVVKSPQDRSLDYYQQHGLKEIDAIIERAGQLMAYDFVYLK
jgi:hypothetical protein